MLKYAQTYSSHCVLFVLTINFDGATQKTLSPGGSGSGKLSQTTVDSRGSRFSKIKNRQMAAVALGISNTALLGALYLIF